MFLFWEPQHNFFWQGIILMWVLSTQATADVPGTKMSLRPCMNMGVKRSILGSAARLYGFTSRMALGIDRHTTAILQYLSKVSCQSLQSTSVGTSKLRTFHDMDTKNTGSGGLKYHEISLMLDSSSAKNGWVLFFDVVVIIKSYSVPLLGLFTTTQTYQKSHKNWLTSNIYHIPVQPKKTKPWIIHTTTRRQSVDSTSQLRTQHVIGILDIHGGLFFANGAASKFSWIRVRTWDGRKIPTTISYILSCI